MIYKIQYWHLYDMAGKYWRENAGMGFDEESYWWYGCQCHINPGSHPLAEINKGYGKPVDSLDRKCQNYKNCHKCVREKHGPDCTGEFNDYEWIEYLTKGGLRNT